MRNTANEYDSDSHMFCTPTRLFSFRDAQFIIQLQHWWKKEGGDPQGFAFNQLGVLFIITTHAFSFQGEEKKTHFLLEDRIHINRSSPYNKKKKMPVVS